MVWRSARRGVRGADIYRRTNRRADQTSVPASETTVVTALTAGRSKRAVVDPRRADVDRADVPQAAVANAHPRPVVANARPPNSDEDSAEVESPEARPSVE